jgi:HlyD family secretion protein
MTNPNQNSLQMQIESPNPSTNPSKTRRQSWQNFDRPVLLQASSVWTRAILATLMGVATCTIVWACVAQIEEAIPASGKLEPQGTVKDVQVPVNGVVKIVHVKDGQRVKQGELLLSLDPTTAQARLISLQQIRAALMQETAYYRAQMQDAAVSPVGTMPMSPQLLSLTKSRSELVAENRLLQAQRDGSTAGLSAEQFARWQFSQEVASTQETAAALEVAQLQQQFAQVGVKLATTRKTLASNQKILANLTPLMESGALAEVQFIRQQQTVDGNQSEVDQLLHEQTRLQSAIAQAQTQVQNTVAVDRTNVMDQLANNNQKLAEIDSQLTKAIVENDKKLAEINSQISQAEQAIQYGEVRAPVDGTVFDLKAHTPGFVVNPAEPVLKLVPNDALVAKVSITNQNIGFVNTNMPVDVRIDSFPFSEFGDIKGTLVAIGSDALPPTQIQPYYTFPAKIQLDRQSLIVNGREVKLQSGMSLTANIKVRKRSIISIFTEQFTRGMESLKFAR